MRLSAIPRPVGLGLLYLAGATLSAVTALKGIQPNDEGLMLQAAARIADGQVPYSDFWWFYPPGQPYLLAGLWSIFGPSLLTWRIVRVLTDAAVALLAYLLARRRAPVPLALAAWLAAAGAMAFPSGPHPFPIALGLALGALLVMERSPVAAGVLAGLCAAWRLEFGAYLGLGVVLAYAVRHASSGSVPFLAAAMRFSLAAVATGFALYLPVVAQAGLGDSWDLLVRYPLTEFGDYQSLPFPIDYDGPLNASSIGGFLSDSAENLLHFYLPLALLIGLGGALVTLLVRGRREDWPVVAAAVFALGMTHYLLTRTDLFHTAPLVVMVSVLAAWALAGLSWRRARLAVPAALAALGLGWALAEGVDRRVREIEAETRAIDLPAADGARTRPARAAELESAVDFVRARVPPGKPIYVTGLRADIVTSGHPLFYVLAERPNPTRYDIPAPSVITSAPVQREITGALERAGLPLIVRWTDRLTAFPEPNRAGRSSGVRLLDDFIAARYREVARFGTFVILERRG